jgi:CRP-like cAMP-binding protein
MPGPSTALLRGVPFLSGLSDEDAASLAPEFVERSYATGELITGEGQQGMSFFVVESGEATVTKAGADIATLGPGASFGELSLFEHGRRSASITAATDMRCWSLPVWSFRAFVDGRPAVAWALLEQLASRIRELDNDQ